MIGVYRVHGTLEACGGEQEAAERLAITEVDVRTAVEYADACSGVIALVPQ